MNRIAGRAGIALLLCLLLLVGFAFFVFEYVTQAQDWVIFPGSPHVYTVGNIGTGFVVSAEGMPLLDLNEGRTYTQDSVLRKATLHWLGDRYGSISAPALSHYAAKVVGYDLLSGVYNYGQNSGIARLSLYANAQTVALEAMGSYKGTVAVYNYKTGKLLCAVTTPTYDPDDVPDEAYEGMYVNRFTQSGYIPGSIFKIVTLAAALETIPDIESQRFVCTGSYEYGVDKVTCEGAHWEQDLQSAFRNSCNCAFAQIADQLGAETLDRYVKQFGVTDSVSFDGVTTAKGNFEVLDQAPVNVAWSAIGQHKDQINPCSFLTFMGAIADGGKGTLPYLVEEITVGTERTYQAKTQVGKRIMSESTAQTVIAYLRSNVAEKYGDYNFPELTVCAKTGTGEVGGDKKPNAMLAGFALDEEYPLAFIVCVEDGGYGSQVCLPIATKVLTACKEAINNG